MAVTTAQEARRIRILVLASNPRSTERLGIDREVRGIEEKLRGAKHRDAIELVSRWAVRVDDLQQALLDVEPDIVHFSGHGTRGEEIILDLGDGDLKPVPKKALARLFKILNDRIRVVVLNACYSRPQAEAIAEHIDCTIGMSDRVPDEAAIAFSAAFYQGIAYGRSVQTAFDLGVNELELKGIQGADIPDIIPRQGVAAKDLILVTPS
jgi:hypothetical protein